MLELNREARNPSLASAFRALAVLAFESLRKWPSSGTKVPGKCERYLFDVPMTNARGVGSRIVPDHDRLAIHLYNSLVDSDEVQECIRLLLTDPQVSSHMNRMVGSYSSYHRVEPDSVIRKFFAALLDEQDLLRFDEKTFFQSFIAMEDFFHSETEEVEVLFPLENFQSSLEIIGLGNGWSIQVLSLPRLGELASIDDSPLPMHVLSRLTHGLFWKGIVRKDCFDTRESSEEEPETTMVRLTHPRILTALRIFKGGGVGFRMQESRRTGWTFAGSSRSISFETVPISTAPYTLEKSDVPSLLSLLEAVLSLPSMTIIDVALKRLNSSHKRWDHYDRLIDLMVGFESLFVKGDESIRSNMPRRGAAALQEMGFVEGEIIRDLKTAWDVRRHIVHGHKESKIAKAIRGTGLSRRRFTDKVEAHLREAIKWYIPRVIKGHKLEEIHNLLDSVLPPQEV